ncbi:MAG: hypothetical protein ABSH19_04940 [Opitutales bacterium]|jgi:hypothetical protein
MRIFRQSSLFARHGLAVAILAWAGLALSSCSTGKELPNKLITFEFQTIDPQEGKSLTMPMSGLTYRYVENSGLTEVDLDGVQEVENQNVPCLLFTFSTAGQRALYRDTASHEGLMMFTFVNDQPIGACRITQPIEDGQLVVFVEIPPDQLTSYVADLQDSIKKIKALRPN